MLAIAFALMLPAAAQDRFVLESTTAPQRLDLTQGLELVIPLGDAKLELAAHVVVTAVGDFVLDELLDQIAEEEPGVVYALNSYLILKGQKQGALQGSVTQSPPKETCVEVPVLGVRVCVPA